MECEQCERCGCLPPKGRIFDYCGKCSTVLCPKCMADGCCGTEPAVSGMETDTMFAEGAE